MKNSRIVRTAAVAAVLFATIGANQRTAQRTTTIALLIWVEA